MKKLTEKQRQLELARIAAIPDDEIDTSDIPELPSVGRSTNLLCWRPRCLP